MSQNSFVCTQLSGFKYRKWLNISIWFIDLTLTGTTTLGHSGLGSNGNERELNITQSSRTRASPSDGLMSYQGQSLGGGVLPLCRNAVSIFYSYHRQDYQTK